MCSALPSAGSGTTKVPEPAEGRQAMHQKAGAVRCDRHSLYDATVANAEDTTPRGEFTRQRLRLLGITVNLAKSILKPLLNRT